MNNTQLGEWADLAMRTGPFFFSLLLFLLTWRFSRLDTGKAGATRQQRTLWLVLSSASYLLATGVMISGLVWWFTRPRLHIFEGSIRNVPSYARVISDDRGFFVREEIKVTDQGEEPLRNIRFVFMRGRKFTPHDVLSVEYLKGTGKREILTIPYSSSEAEPTFEIRWIEGDQNGVRQGKSQIQLVSADSTKAVGWQRLLLPAALAKGADEPPLRADRAKPVYAAPTEPVPAATAQPRRQPQARPSAPRAAPEPSARTAARRSEAPLPGPTLDSEAQSLVAILQDSRTDVGEKILALDKLNRYDAVGKSVLLAATTNAGPVAVTLLDLSRHSDPELASKSRGLLDQDVLREMVQRAVRDRPGYRPTVQMILAALEPERVASLLSGLTDKERESLSPVGSALPAQPIPTGTRTGDRYYVKATWDSKDDKVVGCLTSLFNGALISRRTLAQEGELMRGRKQRLVYGLDRTWAVWIGREIVSCGAQTTYVVPKVL